MLAPMSRSRSTGTSEGIHRLRFRTRTHMRAESVFSRNIDVAPYDRFQIVRHARVCEEISREIRREIHKEINVAVDAPLIARDRAKHSDMHNAAIPKPCFVLAKSIENAG